MYTVHSSTSIEVYKMLSRVVSLGPNKVEISGKDFFSPPDLGLLIGSFTYTSSLVYKNLSLTEVFSFREFIRSFIRFSFFGRGGVANLRRLFTYCFCHIQGKYTNFHLYGFSDR